jgi:hypothetical protein
MLWLDVVRLSSISATDVLHATHLLSTLRHGFA